MPTLRLRTGLLVIFHRREWSRTTNTGHLAVQAVSGSRSAIWGDVEGLVGLDGAVVDRVSLQDRFAFVLTADAPPLDLTAFPPPPAPVLMVVPDGTWRQAIKMPRRIPALAGLPHFSLPDPPEATYHLRQTTRAGGLATLHAIALAIGLIDGPEAEAPLMTMYDAMVAASLEGRGPMRRPNLANAAASGEYDSEEPTTTAAPVTEES